MVFKAIGDTGQLLNVVDEIEIVEVVVQQAMSIDESWFVTTSETEAWIVFASTFSSGDNMSDPPLFVRVRRLDGVPEPRLLFLKS